MVFTGNPVHGRGVVRGAVVMMKGYVLSEDELSACVQREMVIFHQDYARPTRTKQAEGLKWELAEGEQLRTSPHANTFMSILISFYFM